MEVLQEIIEELQEDPVMLALIERQTPEGREAAQKAIDQRLQTSIEQGSLDPQRLMLYGKGLVALTGVESDLIQAAKYPDGIVL